MTVTTPPVPDTNHPKTGVETVIRLRPEQVGQHPDNIRDAGRDIPALAASIKEVGVLVPLIVVPAHTIDGDWPTEVTHLAVDGNRRAAAAAQVGADLPCMVRDNTTTARETATVMAVTGPARDGLTGAEQAHAVQHARPRAALPALEPYPLLRHSWSCQDSADHPWCSG